MLTLRRAAIILALAAPVAAHAQDVVTNCYRNGNVTQCTTNTPPPPVDYGVLARQPNPGVTFLENYLAAKRAQEERQRQLEEQGQREYEAQQAALRAADALADKNAAMKLLQSGDCSGAIAHALSANDLDLATKIKAFCQTPTPANK